ncbi:MAG: hypothetical protein AAF664_26395, partial [Planctomycetota bacterium]
SGFSLIDSGFSLIDSGFSLEDSALRANFVGAFSPLVAAWGSVGAAGLLDAALPAFGLKAITASAWGFAFTDSTFGVSVLLACLRGTAIRRSEGGLAASTEGSSATNSALGTDFVGEVKRTELASIARSPEATTGRWSAKQSAFPETANNNAKSAVRFAHRVLLMLSR